MAPILADIVRLADARDQRKNGPIAIDKPIGYGRNVDYSLSPAPPWGLARMMPRS
jgi:hypothetical protein